MLHFFYFPAGKQFVIKGSLLATGIQEYFVPAILKIGLLKGQLISKCPYEIIVSSKIPTKLLLDFCPEIFCSFLEASWKLVGLLWDLISNIMNKEASRKP